MSEAEKSAELQFAVEDYFLGGKWLDSIEFIFDGASKSQNEEIKELSRVFAENMLAAFFTASTLPVFARRTAYNTGYMTMFGICLTTVLFDGSSEDRIRQAKKALQESIEGPEWSKRLLEMTETMANGYLWNFIQDEAGRKAMDQITNQCAVLVWSWFEILASDIFVLLLNRKAALAAILLKDETTKKYYREKELTSSLEEFNYDLSRHMGDALLQQRRLDNLPAIRSVYELLAKDSDELRKALNQAELWKLYKVRNLIVHRAGVVDALFLRETGDKTEIGTTLRVRPSELNAFMILVGHVAGELVKCAERILS